MSFAITAIVIASVSAVGSIATNIYSTQAANTRQKKVLADARNKEAAQADKLAKAGVQAQQTAKDKAALRRRTQTETILTSPLGISEDATTSKPTILGG